jgi:MFS transporter, NNP family, nitrate/nitrite transporter
MEQQVLLRDEESSCVPGHSVGAVSTVPQGDSKRDIVRRATRVGRSRRISHWDAEDLAAWEAGNKAIARRNLLWSAVIVNLGYSVWAFWPVLELFMPQDVYGFSAGDKLLLGTTATLAGACLRVPYSLATAIFGGRNWAIFSAIVLLIPTIGTMLLLAHPGLPLWPYLVCAALTGLSGGNFAASMSNANALYPHRLKGSALGLAGGIGNLGVPMILLVGLLVIATAGDRQPYWICGLYVVLLMTAGIGATLFMNNVDQHRVEVTRLRSILSAVLSIRDTWLLSLLYLGTFGSFIGFSFAFGQVLQTNFMAAGQSTAQASLQAAELAFTGPLLAALARVYGGRLADRLGGSRVTLMVFGAMVLAAGLLGVMGTFEGAHAGPGSRALMAGYFAGFIALFILSGLRTAGDFVGR